MAPDVQNHPRDHELIATVAHELQAPLAAVRTAAETLAAHEELAAPDRRGLLEIVLDGVGELGRLVDDLLTAARLDAGTLAVTVAPCDAVEVAARAAALAAAAAGRAPPAVETSGPLLALADPDGLCRVLTNLVANAFAHGQGAVTIEAVSEGGRIRITVGDEGPGISPEDRGRIFERYARLPGGSVRGTGLGLAIARELTEAMGGTITVSSRRPQGTLFTVELAAAP